MKKLISFLLMLAVFTSLSAQQDYQLVTDEKSGELIPLGLCSRAELLSTGFSGGFSQEYEAYIPDPLVLDSLRNIGSGFELVIILGAWCSDSREQVPRFLKVMDAAFPDYSMNFYCVDRTKTAGIKDVSGYGVEKVPLFIFFRDGKEAGRIIETPVASLERDMLRILLSP